MPVTPYLFFDGRCEEALNFYKAALGAEIGMMMRFKDNPAPPQDGSCGGVDPAQIADKIMHASFQVGGTTVMASDGYARGQPKFEGFSLSVDAADEAEADRKFAALADGGQVQMPPGKTFFAKRFGMVADRFGVSWMVICE
jgi:PhnB protein